MLKMQNRKILLIVTGGIAAYKSLELARMLKKNGAQVRAVLTAGGAHFVTPLSLSALCHDKVYTDLWSLTDEQEMGHINLARWADLIVVVPASADFLAKTACGFAEDLASTVILAAGGPVLFAPAMNGYMWQNQAVQNNVNILKNRGFLFAAPQFGEMACGETGEGRLIEVADLYQIIERQFEIKGPLSGKKAIVTSGPTFEPLDPVRFIGNRSSGKQGYAIAAALAKMGAQVTLISGPTALQPPQNVHSVAVETAAQMLQACQENLPADIVVCAAAVADWRPLNTAQEKIKKNGNAPEIRLIENQDILATLSQAVAGRPRLVVGFAAETIEVKESGAKDICSSAPVGLAQFFVEHQHLQPLYESAYAKLCRKKCDWLVANNVRQGQVFGEDDNEILLLKNQTLAQNNGRHDNKIEGGVTVQYFARQPKAEIARMLVAEMVRFFENDGDKS